VILTFNSLKFIRPCLDSIFLQASKDSEVIVVDNHSKDGTVEFLKKNYPDRVKLIKNGENLGAAKARNQGIEASCGEWIITLDCDVILKNDFISKITGALTAFNGSVGMLQPKILTADQKKIYSCGISLSRLRRFYDIGKGKTDNINFSVSDNIFGVCSAAGIYKREMLDDVKEESGYFDERFFFLAEDVDLAWRAQKKKWKAIFIPQAVCYHSGNSSGFDQKARQYLCFRNRYYSIIKNEGLQRYFIKFFPALFYDLPRLFYLIFTNRYVFKKNFKLEDK